MLIKLFFMRNCPFNDSPHPHACCSVFSIFYSLFFMNSFLFDDPPHPHACYSVFSILYSLFLMNGCLFDDSPLSHACCSIFSIFYSLFSCMIIHLILHSVSPCIHIHFHFQFLVASLGSLGLPHQDNIVQSWEGRLSLPLRKYTFLP